MTIYGRMDDSVDPNDTNYGSIPSLTSSPSMERLASSVGPIHHNFDNAFYSPLSFDTIEPSSLELVHTSHDDSCLDKCLGNFPPQAIHRNTYAPPFPSRSRFAVPSFPYPYHLPDNNAFQFPPQPFNPLYSDAFSNMGLKYNLNHDIRPGHHTSNSESLIGNNFNASDLGGPSQRPAPDDCASVNCSKYSCSSECCSTTPVCQEEECSGDGTPCDDLHCFDGTSQPLDEMWALNQGWHNSLQPGMTPTLHNQPCNHTNTEHDVAITLRDLSAPGASNTQQQHQPQQDFSQLECPHVGTGQPTDLARSLSLPVPTHSRLSPTPDTDLVPPPLEDSLIPPGNITEHVCQWVTTPECSDAQGTICGHVCNDSYALHEHLCNDHIASLSNRTKYLCLWKGCTRRGDQVFASRNKLRRHLATHTAYKPHKCEICGEGFSAQQALDQHVRTHTGETPYKCDYEGCGKAFKQKSALTMHKRTHTGEKPLECDICGKRFCESSNLSKHRKTHNPDFKFKCDEPGCGSQFIRIDQLRRHQARHDRPKKKQKVRTAAGPSSVSPILPEMPQDSILLEHEQQTQIKV